MKQFEYGLAFEGNVNMVLSLSLVSKIGEELVTISDFEIHEKAS